LSAQLQHDGAAWSPPGVAGVLRADRVLYWRVPDQLAAAGSRSGFGTLFTDAQARAQVPAGDRHRAGQHRRRGQQDGARGEQPGIGHVEQAQVGRHERGGEDQRADEVVVELVADRLADLLAGQPGHARAGQAVADAGEEVLDLAVRPAGVGLQLDQLLDILRPRLAARGIRAGDVREILCEVAEGTVHRLWEPLADKQRPRNGYAAKFAVPYLLAAGFVHGGVGLGAFTEEAIRDERVLALAAKVKFVIDPDNPYPNNYTGHIKATLKDGSVIEDRQPYLRGGAQEPLTRQDVTEKFALNVQHGGWSKAQGEAALKLLAGLYGGKIDLKGLRNQ